MIFAFSIIGTAIIPSKDIKLQIAALCLWLVANICGIALFIIVNMNLLVLQNMIYFCISTYWIIAKLRKI